MGPGADLHGARQRLSREIHKACEATAEVNGTRNAVPDTAIISYPRPAYLKRVRLWYYGIRRVNWWQPQVVIQFKLTPIQRVRSEVRDIIVVCCIPRQPAVVPYHAPPDLHRKQARRNVDVEDLEEAKLHGHPRWNSIQRWRGHVRVRIVTMQDLFAQDLLCAGVESQTQRPRRQHSARCRVLCEVSKRGVEFNFAWRAISKRTRDTFRPPPTQDITWLLGWRRLFRAVRHIGRK